MEETTTSFSAFLDKTHKEEEKRSITDVRHDWLCGIAPTAYMSIRGADDINRTFECEPLIDTGFELELLLPYRKVKQLKLKPIVKTSGPLIVDLPFGGSQELTEFEQIRVKIPYSNGADGACEDSLRVWAHVPSSSEQSLGTLLAPEDEDVSPSKRTKTSESRDMFPLSSSSASMFIRDNVLSAGEDSLGALETPGAKIITPSKGSRTSESSNTSSSSAAGSSLATSADEVFLSYSPVLFNQDTSVEFAIIGFEGLRRLNLRIDTRQKRLYCSRKRRMKML